MEVKITSDKDGSVFLLVSDKMVGPDSIALSFASNIETLSYLRAAGIEPADRGNDSVEAELTLWKSFPTYTDCFAFCADLRSMCPRTGSVQWTVSDSNGARCVRKIEKAAVPRIQTRMLGTSAQVTFNVLGGIITKK